MIDATVTSTAGQRGPYTPQRAARVRPRAHPWGGVRRPHRRAQTPRARTCSGCRATRRRGGVGAPGSTRARRRLRAGQRMWATRPGGCCATGFDERSVSTAGCRRGGRPRPISDERASYPPRRSAPTGGPSCSPPPTSRRSSPPTRRRAINARAAPRSAVRADAARAPPHPAQRQRTAQPSIPRHSARGRWQRSPSTSRGRARRRRSVVYRGGSGDDHTSRCRCSAATTCARTTARSPSGRPIRRCRSRSAERAAGLSSVSRIGIHDKKDTPPHADDRRRCTRLRGGDHRRPHQVPRLIGVTMGPSSSPIHAPSRRSARPSWATWHRSSRSSM